MFSIDKTNSLANKTKKNQQNENNFECENKESKGIFFLMK